MMFQRFQQILQEYHLLDSKKKVLLAVSGGVDSIALFHFMRTIPLSKRPQISIAHFNHQLRESADEEECFVARITKKYDIPFYSQKWPIENHPETGIEAAARIKRYAFFKELMNEKKIDYLMTGHHLDDQVETIIMRLTRGASLEQLLGIRLLQPFTLDRNDGYLIRPLLKFSKEELYQLAKAEDWSYVEDESNQEMDFTRNRFRNQIIPLLKDENERFNEHVERFRIDLSDIIEISQEPIQKAYKKAVHASEEGIHLELTLFTEYSKAFQRAIIKKILETIYTGKTARYKANYIDLVCNWLLDGDVNTSLDLIDSYLVEKRYSEAIFMKRPSRKKDKIAKEFTLDRVNQWIELSATETIGLFLKDEMPEVDATVEVDILWLPEDSLYLPLQIRHRKAGDRMTYKGLNGRKKIKDIFIDDKTPLEERDEAWIVEDNDENILWLISHRKMDLFTDAETDKLLYGLYYFICQIKLEII